MKQMRSGAVLIGGGKRGWGDLVTRARGPAEENMRLGAVDAVEVVPVLARAETTRSWVGLEGLTADEMPIIDHVAGTPRRRRILRPRLCDRACGRAAPQRVAARRPAVARRVGVPARPLPGGGLTAMRLASTDVVVIGGGVIGLAAAYYLAQAGKRVTLVERRGIGQEASGANVGLVTLFSGHSFDEPDPGPVYELTRASIDAYATLGEELDVDIEYERCGGVVYAETEDKLAVIRRAYDGYRAHGVPVEWLDARGIRECEPVFFSERVLGGVYCPLNGQINPLMLCRALARGARRLGARIMLGTTAQDVFHGNGRVRAVRTSEGDIPCELAVNAAGAWAADIGEMVGQRLPVSPARGQIVLTEPMPRFIHRVISGAEPSARQTRRGNIIIGGTVEDVGFDKRVTPDAIEHFTRGVVSHYPGLAGLGVIRAWAGLRPATPDHKPIIELCGEPAGLCLAVGHSRRGICYAAGTGRLVAELVTGARPYLDLGAFSLSRFAGAQPALR